MNKLTPQDILEAGGIKMESVSNSAVAESVVLSVFDVKASREKLVELVQSFEMQDEWYSLGGLRVSEIKEIPGLYRFVNHKGSTEYKTGLVRIVDSQVWTKEYAQMIEAALRKQNLSYEMAQIKAEKAETLSAHPKPFDIAGKIKVRYASPFFHLL